MTRKNTYFISDLHLGASYIGDTHAHQRRVVDFLQSIEPKAKALYLLGDVLDYWFEYRTVAPQGFVRFFGQLARMADAGIEIVWLTGNHDIWMNNYLAREIGVEIIDAPGEGIERLIDGSLFFLSHGDNFGPQPVAYRCLRSVFHNRLCRKLFSGIHPRWTVSFAHRWSSHSRKTGGYAGAEVPSAVIAHARAMAADKPLLHNIIIGHYHRPAQLPLGGECTLTVLGNWVDRSDYAVFDGQTLSLCSYEPSTGSAD